jgi:hypothetical protein
VKASFCLRNAQGTPQKLGQAALGVWPRVDYQAIFKSPRQCHDRPSQAFTFLRYPATMLFSFSVFVSALIAGASASNVLELTPDNFDSIVGQGKPALVEL